MTERTWVSSLRTFVFICCLLVPLATQAQGAPSTPSADGARPRVPRVCRACIRAHMEFLASDALRGRGSGSADELVAATYVASQLRQYGIMPAGDKGTYLQ